MSNATLPSTLQASHQLIRQLHWRVQQLEKELFGPSSERQSDEPLSQEQVLLSLFAAPAQLAATQQVLVRLEPNATEPRTRRQPAAKVLETIRQRIEPEEKVCPHCGTPKCEIGCERSERFEYVPAKLIRHEIVRPKLACSCGQAAVSIAPLPAQLIEQGQAGAGPGAQGVFSKHDGHCPPHPPPPKFSRLGGKFSRPTLCG